MMKHWRVKDAFDEDKKWIDWADVLIMLMPCGRSSHLEAGYAAGTGKKLYIVGGFEKGEFDTMYGFADGMYDYAELSELLSVLNKGIDSMMELSDLTPNQRLHVMGSDRYSIRDTQVHDDVTGHLVTVDDIVENMAER